MKSTWFYGVGIRIAKDGTIYNARPGFAIKIPIINSEKHIYIGTKRQNEFIEACKTIELKRG